ncbi:MAG: universal stress protein [Bernardetiaceae bacterium]
MYRIDKILVGLDLSYMDDKVMAYAANIARIVKAKRILFVYFADKNWPKALTNITKDEVPQSFDGAKLHFVQHVKEKVARYFPEREGSETVIRIEEGDPLAGILQMTKLHNIDLVTIGRKADIKHTRLLTKRLVRKCNSSVLCVPENYRTSIDKILLPITYDRYARYAVERAFEFAHDNPNVHLVCLNVYQVPGGYHAVGKTYEEFAEVMHKQSQNDYRKFIRQFDATDIEIQPKFELSKTKGAAAEVIYQQALIEHADLIVMGSKGRTFLSARFSTSTAEKLSLLNINIPLLVLKDRHFEYGLLKAVTNT